MDLKKDSKKMVINKLNSYAIIQKNIEYIENKIKIIDSELTRVKISKFDETRNSGVEGCRIEKLLDDKISLNNELNDFKLKRKFMIELINILEGIEKEIIIDFYFKKYSISKISNMKLYSERRIRQIRENALNKLNKFII